jgi:Kelch motif
VVQGGERSGNVYKTIMWILQPTSNAPLARCAHAADCIDGKLYVFGGWSESKMFNDLHVYDPGKCRHFFFIIMAHHK